MSADSTRSYVAVSRIRSLAQLHLWGLDMTAFRASPRIKQQYELLRQRLLDQVYIDQFARPRRQQAVPAMAAAVSSRSAASRVSKRGRDSFAADGTRATIPRHLPTANSPGSSAMHANMHNN